MEEWKRLILAFVMTLCAASISLACDATVQQIAHLSNLDKELVRYVDSIFSTDNLTVIPGIKIEKVTKNATIPEECNSVARKDGIEVTDYFYNKLNDYGDNHVVKVNLSNTARFFSKYNCNIISTYKWSKVYVI